MAGTPVTDDTSKTITGRLATADFTWDDGVKIRSLKCALDVMRIREIIPMDTANTFCTENASDQEPGTPSLLFEIGGLGRYDGENSKPLIPAPQNVALVLTFHTDCELTMTANFSEASIDKIAGQSVRMGARGINKGAYTLDWDYAGA